MIKLKINNNNWQASIYETSQDGHPLPENPVSLDELNNEIEVISAYFTEEGKNKGWDLIELTVDESINTSALLKNNDSYPVGRLRGKTNVEKLNVSEEVKNALSSIYNSLNSQQSNEIAETSPTNTPPPIPEQIQNRNYY